jgi:UDP-N-acetylglucosamine 2-epimerase (non-hydrolysing)
MEQFGLTPSLKLFPPLGFFDFVKLEYNARCVLTDSGTVQEECTILGIPSVTLRDVTERPETVECGASILSGTDPKSILDAANIALTMKHWEPPAEYMREDVSSTVIKILLGV